MSSPKHKQFDNHRSIHQTAKYFAVTFLLFFALLEALTVGQLYNNFFQQQLLLAESTSKGIKNNIENFVSSKKFQLNSFVSSEKELLQDLADFPVDPENLDRLNTLIHQRISGVFSYMIASAEGLPLLEEKLTTVGPVCLVGIKSYVQNHQSLPSSVVTHGSNAGDFHFDIMTTLNLEDDNKGVFFISFRLNSIIQLLANAELPNQSLIISKQTEPEIIEMSAQGVRKSDFVSNLNSTNRVATKLFQADIQDTNWRIIVLTSKEFLQSYLYKIIWLATAVFALILTLNFLFLRFLREEELKRFATESELANSNENLEKTVLKRTLALNQERDRAHVTLNSIGDGVITTNANGYIESINPLAQNLTGWNENEAIGQPINEVFKIVNEESREPVKSPVDIVFDTLKPCKLEENSVLITRYGYDLAIEDSCAPIFDRKKQLLGTVLVFHDSSQQRKILKAIEYKANHDSLTGILNRSAFEHRFQLILSRLEKQEKSNILLYMDLDHFKQVNDTAGHAAGDELLKRLVKKIEEILRQRDVFARMGGDEFAVILENCSPEKGQQVAEKIQNLVAEFVLHWKEEVFSVGISIGTISFCNHSASKDILLNQADTACYQAKNSGGNTVSNFEV